MTTQATTDEDIGKEIGKEKEKGTLAVDVNEAARLLRLGRHTTWALVHSGQLRAVRVGRRWIVPRSELERFLSQHIFVRQD